MSVDPNKYLKNYHAVASLGRSIALMKPPRKETYCVVIQESGLFRAEGVVPPALLSHLERVDYQNESYADIVALCDAIEETGCMVNPVKRLYAGVDGLMCELRGIEVEGVTVWFNKNAPTPRDPLDLTVDTAKTLASGVQPRSPIRHSVPIMRQVPVKVDVVEQSNEVVTESVETTWFGEIAKLPQSKREWLMLQFKAALIRIGGNALYEELESNVKAAAK